MQITFGILSDSLEVQLKEFNLPKETTKKYDDIANFIMCAHIFGKLTDKQETKLFDYLVTLIEREIKTSREQKLKELKGEV